MRAYRDAIKAVAAERDGLFVDLYDESGETLSTLDGILPDDTGYWQLARRVLRGLGLDLPAWSVSLDAAGKPGEVKGTTLKEV